MNRIDEFFAVSPLIISTIEMLGLTVVQSFPSTKKCAHGLGNCSQLPAAFTAWKCFRISVLATMKAHSLSVWKE